MQCNLCNILMEFSSPFQPERVSSQRVCQRKGSGEENLCSKYFINLVDNTYMHYVKLQ